MMRKRAAGLLGLAMAAGALVQATPAQAPPAQASPAQAAGSSATATYCSLALGSWTYSGDHILRTLTATTPPTAGASRWGGKDLVPDVQIQLAGGLGFDVTADQTGMSRRQYVVLGPTMYLLNYAVKGFDGDVVPGSVKLTEVGGGWGGVRDFENSKYNSGGKLLRHHAYAVQGDNILRWSVDSAGFHAKRTYAGYRAVKAMALISQTATYDTFLAITGAGALYTIRIPVSGAPVVKVVRRSTWQVFENLIAARCGNYGTLLLAIDRDTGAPYMYALGHANGAATVIKSLGKVNRTFTERLYFRYYDDTETYPQLFGE